MWEDRTHIEYPAITQTVYEDSLPNTLDVTFLLLWC